MRATPAKKQSIPGTDSEMMHGREHHTHIHTSVLVNLGIFAEIVENGLKWLEMARKHRQKAIPDLLSRFPNNVLSRLGWSPDPTEN